MDWQTYIHRSPQIMLGKPVFKGTRITVQHVLERLGQGASNADLLTAHPRLTADHLTAADCMAKHPRFPKPGKSTRL